MACEVEPRESALEYTVGRSGIKIPNWELQRPYHTYSNPFSFFKAFWELNGYDCADYDEGLREERRYFHELVLPPEGEMALLVIRGIRGVLSPAQQRVERERTIAFQREFVRRRHSDRAPDMPAQYGHLSHQILTTPRDAGGFEELLGVYYPLQTGAIGLHDLDPTRYHVYDKSITHGSIVQAVLDGPDYSSEKIDSTYEAFRLRFIQEIVGILSGTIAEPFTDGQSDGIRALPASPSAHGF